MIAAEFRGTARPTSRQILTEIVKQEHVIDKQSGMKSPWRGSGWKWLVLIPPLNKAKHARNILAQFLARRNIHAVVAPRGAAILVGPNGDRVSVRFSMAGGPQELFHFQQLREQESGSYVACFGVTPQREYLWLVPIGLARALATNQHGSDIEKWMTFRVDNPPAPLADYGGTMDEGFAQFDKVWGEA